MLGQTSTMTSSPEVGVDLLAGGVVWMRKCSYLFWKTCRHTEGRDVTSCEERKTEDPPTLASIDDEDKTFAFRIRVTQQETIWRYVRTILPDQWTNQIVLQEQTVSSDNPSVSGLCLIHGNKASKDAIITSTSHEQQSNHKQEWLSTNYQSHTFNEQIHRCHAEKRPRWDQKR